MYPDMPSSVVQHMHYNPVSKTLTITYVSGNVYNYLEVPETMFKKMKAASSKGEFLNQKIKGKYAFEKVE
jgi:hypothetical protein